MSRVIALVSAAVLLAVAATAGWSMQPGTQFRMAGRGTEGPYYLATDVEVVKLVTRQRFLKYLLDDVRQPISGDLRAAVEKDFASCDAEQSRMLAAERLVAVPYNTVVTTLDQDELVKFPLLSDPAETFGRNHSASRIRVRVEDGPLKGRELFAVTSSEMKSLNRLAETDRVWVRAGPNAQIPVGNSQADTSRFWDAYRLQDGATVQGMIDAGQVLPLPAEVQGTVTDAGDLFYTQIEVAVGGAMRRVWVPTAFLSLVPGAPTP